MSLTGSGTNRNLDFVAARSAKTEILLKIPDLHTGKTNFCACAVQRVGKRAHCSHCCHLWYFFAKYTEGYRPLDDLATMANQL